MSEAVSVMNGASFEGAVKIRDAGLMGMITLRGDLGDETLGTAVKAVLGLAMPKPREIRDGKKGSVAWMSPDELLLIVDYAAAPGMVAALEDRLKGIHTLVVDVSDARAFFTLTGPGVREVIAKGAPADLSPEGLKPGEIRRSRLGQVAAAFWLPEEDTMNVVCFRSVGAFVYSWLCNAAEKNTLPGFFI